MQTSTQLIRYDIVLNTGDDEGELNIFLQMCIWARRPKDQFAYHCIPYGIVDEYMIYSCNLSDEDLLCLKLKFSGIIHVTPTVYDRTDPDAIFEAAMGEPYYHSLKARAQRAAKLLSAMT